VGDRVIGRRADGFTRGDIRDAGGILGKCGEGSQGVLQESEILGYGGVGIGFIRLYMLLGVTSYPRFGLSACGVRREGAARDGYSGEQRGVLDPATRPPVSHDNCTADIEPSKGREACGKLRTLRTLSFLFLSID
jgi:hypothetical protein